MEKPPRKMESVTRHYLPVALTLILLLLPWSLVKGALPNHRSPMVSLISGNHLLGFQADGFYVGGGDHMLHVGFLQSSGSVPRIVEGTLDPRRATLPKQVQYTDLWPGIDLSYETGTKGIAQSTWRIAPGSHPSMIRLSYSAIPRVQPDGSLKILLENGWMRESAPIAWQVVEDQRIPVVVSFKLLATAGSRASVGFEVGDYRSDLPLLIDPVLQWNTFMGAAAEPDQGRAIAVDANHNVYVTGTSSNAWNGDWGDPVNAYNGNRDAFLVKFDAYGRSIWHTFIGAAHHDDGYALDVDDNGGIYVAGTSTLTWGTPINGLTGSTDAFVAKFDSDGELLWNTFMGSADPDEAVAIHVNGAGTLVHISGKSANTWGTPVNAHAGGTDALVSRLDGNGNRLWHTFMGSNNADGANAVAADSDGNVYTGGLSTDTWGTPVNAHAGNSDAFAAKLNTAGALVWHTFLGSGSDDEARAIDVAGDGSVYLAGSSAATWGAPNIAYTGGVDGFAAKLDSNGARLWNTFLGSAGDDDAAAAYFGSEGTLLVAGSSDATWGTPLNDHAGSTDAFSVELDSDGALIWSTFVGSVNEDTGNGISQLEDRIYITGSSRSTWGTPGNPHNGAELDAFAAMLSDNPLPEEGCKFFTIRTASNTAFTVCL